MTDRGKSGKLHNGDVTNSSLQSGTWAGLSCVHRLYILLLREQTPGFGSASSTPQPGDFWMLFSFSKFQLLHLYKWK